MNPKSIIKTIFVSFIALLLLWSTFISVFSGSTRQHYFASFDGNYIQTQYVASADPVLHRWCSNTFSESYLQGSHLYFSFWGGGRYVVVESRFENGKGNCYYRRF